MVKKLFVVVRNDLTRSQKTVQAVHAAAEYLQKEKTDWDNGIVVCLKVSDEKELVKLKEKIQEEDRTIKCFYEPDLDNTLTAIAKVCYKDSEFFRHLQLL
ncbi:hypothetical protein N9948_00330 [bacterium]|nr:hypothetical protein [bacterium]